MPDGAAEHAVDSADGVPALADALARLRSMASLEPDWDSYGAEPPSRSALEAARDIINEVATGYGDLPGFTDTLDIAPTPDGGVLLMWGHAGRETQVRVNRDARLDALLIDDVAGELRYREQHDIPRSRALKAIARVFSGERAE